MSLHRSKLIVIITCLLLMTAAHAQLTDDVDAQSPCLSVTGTAYSTTVSPGGLYTHIMTVENCAATGSLDITVDSGGLRYAPEGTREWIPAEDDTSPYSAREFITIDLEDQSFSLAAGGTQQVEAHIEIPPDVGDGGRYAMIRISGVGGTVRTDVPVLLIVGGSLIIDDGEITELAAPYALVGEPIEISTDFKNTGNHHFRVRNRVLIKNSQQTIVAERTTSLTSVGIIPTYTHHFVVNPITIPPGTILPEGSYQVESHIIGEDNTIYDSETAWLNIFAGIHWFVDADATGSNDGSNWTDALTDLQDALTAAMFGDQIWVAEGTYCPGTDRTDTFQMKSGVGVYGGFSGVESSTNDRDWKRNVTVLSGDIGVLGNNLDNCHHVVTGSATDSTATLDGFTITGGNAGGPEPDNRGGGMHNNGGSPTIINCIFDDNSAGDDGGAMYNIGSNPTVTYCTFTDNSAGDDGGAMYNIGSNPTVTYCTFTGNAAFEGGGMFNDDDSGTCAPIVTDCVFTGNSAVEDGGGMTSETSALVVNCTFSGNWAAVGGGMSNSWSSPTVTNCTFYSNSATTYGGGALTRASGYDGGGGATITNCVLWDNTAPTGAQLAIDGSSPYSGIATVGYSDVKGGQTGVYVESGSTLNWGSGNIDAHPLFVDPSDGNLHLLAGSPCIDVGDNGAVPPGVTTDPDGDLRIVDGNGDSNATVDMGADEYLNFPPPWDVNGDHVTNIVDVAVIGLPGNWGSTAWIRADANKDGIVNIADVAFIGVHWQEVW